MHPLTEKFMVVFAGLRRVHGSFILTGQVDSKGKIKGKSETVIGTITPELWSDHLEGKKGLGIVPITDEGVCCWGVIDVDRFDLDLPSLAKKIRQHNLPLIPIRSKSGGAHLAIFFDEMVQALLVRQKLQLMASFLGFGGCEIFPKQTELLTDRGDTGSWLNMPYFNASQTMRYAIGPDGKSLTADEFITYVTSMKVGRKQLEDYQAPTLSGEMFKDGPPCLQHLHHAGFVEGSRNNTMLNVGVYLKKANPDGWEKDLEQYNSKTQNPLPSNEVQNIIRSLKKKEYFYTCKNEPLKSCCNAQLCRTRKHGVGEENVCVIVNLMRYLSTPPLWFASLADGGRVQLTTEELFSQTKFQLKCMETCKMLPFTMKSAAWHAFIREKMESAEDIPVPDEATNVGYLLELLERFCTGRVQASTEDEIVLGKPWTDKGRHYFKLSGFMMYLDRLRFTQLKQNQVIVELKELKFIEVQHHAKNMRGRYTNYWSIKAFEKSDEPLEPIKKKENVDAY